jgi:glycosyltransferase involved in cell wall biosynthesis
MLTSVTSSPNVSVVVPAYRAAETIAACLRGLQGQDLEEPFEVIVVASGGDATVDIVRRGFPRIVLLASGERLTPGAARNLGVARSRGEVVAFLAADCVPEPDWLRRRVEAHRAGHDLVGGYLDVMTPSTLAGWAQYFSKFWGVLALGGRTFTGRGPLFHLSYTRAVLERGGDFLDAVAGEDTAYNHNLVAGGARVHFDAAIRARHVNTRRFTDVVAAQREQGAATGALCRDQVIAAYYAPSVRGGRLGPLRTTLRAAAAVLRYRPGLLGRFLVSSPLVLLAIRARRAAFRSALAGARDEVPEGSSSIAREVTAAPGGRPRVSVVVAAFDEERVIARCLDSLLAQSCASIEIIVADDGSRDRTVAIAASRGVPVLCLAHRGPAAARNAGAAVARGDVLVFVDADLELDRDSVAELAAPILAGDEVGTFTRDIGVANPSRPWSACWSLRRGVAPGSYMPATVPDRWINFRAVARADFLRVGGFDDVGYGEDITLGRKLERTAAVVQARMLHHNPDSLREVWHNAVWFGRGERIRELPKPWRRYGPWQSLRRSIRVAVANRRPRYVAFATVYDVGILTGLLAARVRPGRHWK